MINRFIQIVLLLIVQVAFSQNPPVTTAIGEGKAAQRNITFEQARQQAFQRAREDGIQNALGIDVQGVSIVRNAAFAGEFIFGTTYGHIVKTDTLLDTLIVEKFRGEMFPVYHVRLQVEVVPEKGKPDPSFKVALELNKNTFVAGEELWMTIRTSKDCYAMVINVDANDDIYVMFPNRYLSNNFMPANAAIQIPSQEERSMGIRYRVSPLQGHTQDTELIMLIATQKPITLLEDVEEQEGVQKFKNNQTALTELAKWLAAIPASERTIDLEQYNVFKE